MKTIFSLLFCTYVISATSQNTDSLTFVHSELLMRADSLMANYKFERALKVLSRGDSLNTDILLRIGQCHFSLGATGTAIRPYEHVLRIDSFNVTALNHLGQLYARNGDYAKAMTNFTRLVELDTTNSYYCKQAGLMANRAGEKMMARYWFRKALNLNPADGETALALGNILMEMGLYESVDAIAQQALAVDPEFRPMLLLRARSAFEQKQYGTVIIVINNLLEKTDTTALHARILGVSYFHQKEYSKLANCMSYLLKNRYDQDWIYYYMGIASRAHGDVPASVRWFRLAAEKSISANTKIYYSELGQSYEEAGDYQGAIKAYRAAYNYSSDGIFLYHLARNYDVYYEDKTPALIHYKKYLESDDTIRLAREYAQKRIYVMEF